MILLKKILNTNFVQSLTYRKCGYELGMTGRFRYAAYSSSSRRSIDKYYFQPNLTSRHIFNHGSSDAVQVKIKISNKNTSSRLSTREIFLIESQVIIPLSNISYSGKGWKKAFYVPVFADYAPVMTFCCCGIVFANFISLRTILVITWQMMQ